MANGPNRKPPDNAGIDTGPGGFIYNGKLYSAITVEDGDDYTPVDDTYRNDVAVDKTQKDIAPSVKVVLGQFLSNLTHGKTEDVKHPNDFPIDSNTNVVEIKLTTSDGKPSSLAPSRNTSQYENLLTDEISTPIGTPGSAILANEGFKPGISNEKYNGNNVLTSEGAPLREKYVSHLLKKNRFTADAPRGEDPTAPAYGESIRYYDNVTSVGVSPSGNGSDGKSSSLERGRDISFSRLSTIGATLSMRASMEIGSLNPEFNPNGGAATAGALLPSFNQLMLERVSTQNLEVKNFIDTLTNAGIDEAETLNVTSLSWGSLNNVNDPYDGITALGMVTTAVALSLAMIAATTIVSTVFTAFGGGTSSTTEYKNTTTGRRPLGQHAFTEPTETGGSFLPISFDIPALLGIKRTKNPLALAVDEGVKLFFLGPNKSIDFSDFFNTPGYTAVHARNILRSAITFVDAFKGVASGSPVDVVKKILNIIDVLRRSKFIAAINVFAMLGDASLNEKVTRDGTGRILTVLDLPTGNAASRDRMDNGVKLAYATSTAPELALLPQFIHTAPGLGGPDRPFSVTGIMPGLGKVKIAATSKSRLDNFDVAILEKEYDAEYLPFYFHDLRTNEIVGFHAFLETLNDSYTPQYESIDGIGRIDPVKIYKATGRKISLAFSIVSTSPEDNDEMYRKINKLVTLVYPQFSSGKTLSSEDGKFVFKQPFSQIATSTPIIRLRVGDIVRSNFSRFDLARLFGYGDPNFDMKLDGTSTSFVVDDVTARNQSFRDKVTSILQTLNNGEIGAGGGYAFRIAASSYPCVDNDATPYLSLNSINMGAFEFTPVGTRNGNIKMRCDLIDDPDYRQSDALDNFLQYVGVDLTVPGSEESVVGKVFEVPPALILSMSPTTRGEKKLKSDLGIPQTSGLAALTSFMSAENNAIVGAFYQTSGKGLPGVIESLSFDWGDQKNLWRLEEPGKKAPLYCKVSIDYIVIHDIAPGIDHMGSNRAPIYPLGPYVHEFDKEFGLCLFQDTRIRQHSHLVNHMALQHTYRKFVLV